jgi:hypothetical protein
MEADVAKERTARAADAGRLSALSKAAAALKKVQADLQGKLKAADAKAAALEAANEGLAKRAAAAQLEAGAARAKLAHALAALRDDVATALDTYAAGGYGKAGAAGMLGHLKSLGVNVDARAKDFEALNAPPAASRPRLELSVDSSTFTRQLRLVSDDPARIARALAAGAARTRPGIDVASLAMPLRAVKSPRAPPPAVLASPAKPAALVGGAVAGRRPASAPKVPSLDPESPPASPRARAGPRFKLKAVKAAPAPKRPAVPRLGLDVGLERGAGGATRRLALGLDDGLDDLNGARDLVPR